MRYVLLWLARLIVSAVALPGFARSEMPSGMTNTIHLQSLDPQESLCVDRKLVGKGWGTATPVPRPSQRPV